jgi:hypothetical protein
MSEHFDPLAAEDTGVWKGIAIATAFLHAKSRADLAWL